MLGASCGRRWLKGRWDREEMRWELEVGVRVNMGNIGLLGRRTDPRVCSGQYFLCRVGLARHVKEEA